MTIFLGFVLFVAGILFGWLVTGDERKLLRELQHAEWWRDHYKKRYHEYADLYQKKTDLSERIREEKEKLAKHTARILVEKK